MEFSGCCGWKLWGQDMLVLKTKPQTRKPYLLESCHPGAKYQVFSFAETPLYIEPYLKRRKGNAQVMSRRYAISPTVTSTDYASVSQHACTTGRCVKWRDLEKPAI